MQIFFFPEWLTIVLFFVLWFCFQLGAGWLCFRKPDDFFNKDTFLYRTRKWERDGLFYEQWFRIKKWKKYLPDGGGFFNGGYTKRHIVDFSVENLQQYLIESRRAELTHWLGIFPFWIFGLFAPFHVIWIMLVYALVVNVPCIIAQRYNRPRIMKLLTKKKIR
jgi:hypothetical protein